MGTESARGGSVSKMDTKEYRKEFSGLGLRMLVCAVIINGVQIISQFVLLLVKPDWASDINIVLAFTMIPQYVIGFPIAFRIMRSAGDIRTIEKHKMRPLHFLAAFPMSYTFLIAGNIIGLIVTFGIGYLKGEPVTNQLQAIVGNSNIWLTAIYTVLLAPIFEELLFRKMICDRVVKYGQGAAVILSGLMFGLFHGNFNQFFYAYAIGSFFAFIYVKTGDIKYTIGLHMIVNFIGTVIEGLFLQRIDLEHLTLGSLFFAALNSLLVYGIVIAGFVLILVNISKLKVDEGEIVLAKRERNKIMLVNVGMILFYVFFVIMMIVQAIIG